MIGNGINTFIYQPTKEDYVVINFKWEDMGQIAPEEISSCATPLEELYKNRRFVIYKIGG